MRAVNVLEVYMHVIKKSCNLSTKMVYNWVLKHHRIVKKGLIRSSSGFKP